MQPTREIRWFLPHPLHSVDSWFAEQGHPLDEAQSRTDRYLLLPGIADLGLKLREGSLEPKKRLGPGKRGTLGRTAEGVYESWIKWSFPLEAGYNQNTIRGSHWLEVKKIRTTVYVHLDHGRLCISPGTLEPDSGCQVEYSRILLNGTIWYSYCLEWFGSSDLVMDDLSDSILGVNKLKAEDSFSYPELFIRAIKK